jgi:hypothetical protein
MNAYDATTWVLVLSLLSLLARQLWQKRVYAMAAPVVALFSR